MFTESVYGIYGMTCMVCMVYLKICMYACRAYSTKLGHVCDFSEKGQKNVEKGLKRAKYLKI